MEADARYTPRPTRRFLLAAGSLILVPAPVLAASGPPPGRRLAFAVFRNGARVGDHLMTFAGERGAMTVSTQVAMTVKLGPVPVYRYSHRAVERWSGGQFASLETTTNGNGKIQKVTARRTDGGVIIEGAKSGKITAPASALPLTHWNAEALSGPLFNPQEGKMLKVSARRVGRETINGVSATRWSLTGETQIDDWYDANGAWVALRGKLPDGSTMEYRRV
ncbi:DUF6134 family protein [Phenylobacterium sp.]|uniref:DUF6134 family protein n=1 Tax=Phenylobacterium sp. TaxID=1871053 RepID=UPI00286A6DCC|nr:DUF6134 family protein [Phenylobacterium sp.]